MQWSLTQAEFAATRKRAAAINARAAKRGFTGRIEVTGTEREVTETDATGLKRTQLVMDTEITGQAPCYNGWTFLAAVDTIATEAGHDFVLRAAPGVEETDVDRSTLKPGHCGHCRTDRANRVHTYLVRHVETGETVQVGSTCIKDFTGWAGKPVFISTDELDEDLRDFLGGFGRGRAEYTPETIVSLTWAISRRYGWVPAAAAGYGTPSTREMVSAYLYGSTDADVVLRMEVAPEIAPAEDMAKVIIPALLQGLEGNGDYVTNLKALLRAAYVEDRHMGIVVSAVSAYERMIGKQVEREARQEKVTEYAGTVGKKITFTGTVARLIPMENDYGYQTTSSMLVIVEDGAHVFKMFTSAGWAWEVEQGQEATITGAVKAHEEYRGEKQTVIVRPKKAQEPAPVVSEDDRRAQRVRDARAWADVNLTSAYPNTPARYTREELAAMPDEEILRLVEDE